MDVKSITDELNAKRKDLDSLVTNAKNLKDKIRACNSVDDAVDLDKQLTENANKMTALNEKIATLETKLTENGGTNMHKEVKNYRDTAQAVKDWAEIYRNSTSKEEADAKWENKLVENGVTISGDTSLLPTQIDLGIQNTIAENPIFGLMQRVGAGNLVYKKFTTSDKAIARGEGYNITENKTEQAGTLEVRDLPQNEIYKLTSVSYKAMKNMGAQLNQFIATELSQYVIDKVVELALYDGTGTTTGAGAGFDAIVDANSAAVHVEYPHGSSLSKAIRANAFLATGANAAVIDNNGKTTGENNRVLIVNRADYGKILDDALALSYNVGNMPEWLGVDSIIIKDTDSAKYKPIVMSRNAYIVAMDNFDKFDWYNVLNNRNVSEVVTLANGTLFQANSAVVFTEAAE